MAHGQTAPDIGARHGQIAAKYGQRTACRRLLSLTMTPDEPPLVSAQWPHLAAELVTALHEEGETDLATKVDALRVLEQCDCDDNFCQSFYTAAKPAGAYGAGHRNVGLSPSKPGYLILDVVDDEIMYIEVLHRPSLT